VLTTALGANFKHGGGGSCVMKKRVTLPWTSAPLPCPTLWSGGEGEGDIKEEE